MLTLTMEKNKNHPLKSYCTNTILGSGFPVKVFQVMQKY